MTRCTTASKPSTRGLNKGLQGGFSVVELLVAAAIGLVILALGLALTLSSRNLVQRDHERTSASQDLRSSVELIASDVRLAGERLTGEGAPAIPAVEIRGGSELIIRRNVLESVLPVCSDSASSDLLVSLVGTAWGTSDNPSCNNETRDKTNPDGTASDGTGMPDDFETWQAYRTANSGTVRVYIYSQSREFGEFFSYSGEAGTGSGWALVRSDAGAWEHPYSMSESGSLYMLEERHYRLREGALEVVVNGDEENPLRIANNVETLTFGATMKDGSKVSDISDDWHDLAAVEVSLQLGGRTLTSEFFPRNILSQ